MSRITEDHRVFAHLPDSDLYDLKSDKAALLKATRQPHPTYWPTCRNCDAPFPADAPDTLLCGNCRLSEHEL